MNTNPAKAIRILIVDDHEIFRIGLREALSNFPDMKVVGEATDGEEAARKTRHTQPDIILLNIGMPVLDGIQTTLRLKECNSSSKIIMLTSIATGESIFSAIKSGAMGYLLKDSSLDELVHSIRDVAQGKPSFTPSIAFEALAGLCHDSEEKKEPEKHPLTPREVEILQLVAEGKGNKTIAKELVVSEATVSTHMNNILSKLQLTNRVQATLYALKQGLASL